MMERKSSEHRPDSTHEYAIPFRARAEDVLGRRIELLNTHAAHLERLRVEQYADKIWVEKQIGITLDAIGKIKNTLKRLSGIPVSVQTYIHTQHYDFATEKNAHLEHTLKSLNRELERVSERLLSFDKSSEERMEEYRTFSVLLDRILDAEQEQERFQEFVEQRKEN